MITFLVSFLNVVFVIFQGYNQVQTMTNNRNVVQNYQQTQQPTYYLDNNTGIWYMYHNGQWYIVGR